MGETEWPMVDVEGRSVPDCLLKNNMNKVWGPGDRTQALMLAPNNTLPTELWCLVVIIIRTKHNIRKHELVVKTKIKTRVSLNEPMMLGHIIFFFLIRRFRLRHFYLRTSCLGVFNAGKIGLWFWYHDAREDETSWLVPLPFIYIACIGFWNVTGL